MASGKVMMCESLQRNILKLCIKDYVLFFVIISDAIKWKWVQ